MRCPKCENTLNVVNTRESASGNKVWRRRCCKKCNATFSSYERLKPENIVIIKSSGKRVRYKREKVFGSIFKSGLISRNTDFGELAITTESIIDKIENYLILLNTKHITTKSLRNLVIKFLKIQNKQLYLSYKAYYTKYE